jgi:hypothetical protein
MKFDKIKLLSDIKNISCIKSDCFEKKMKNGRIVGWHYKQEYPFLLSIEKKNQNSELVIEFTGKILEEQYPELINSNTIKQCLTKINKLGVCELKVDSILEDAVVLKCDVTFDVNYDDLRDLTTGIRVALKNYHKYSCRLDGDNLTITNNVSTKNRKIRLVIYDKEKEMGMARNADYCTMTGCDNFKGKIRFELNLNSVAQIKKRLKIKSTTLDSVLNSPATPIIDFLNEIIVDRTEGVVLKNVRQYEHWLLLEKCDKDLAKVEVIVRNFSSPRVSVNQMMKPYRELLNNFDGESNNIREELNHLLTS